MCQYCLKKEKKFSEITNAIESIMPEVLIGITSHTESVATALETRILSQIETSNLGEHKKKESAELLRASEGGYESGDSD